MSYRKSLVYLLFSTLGEIQSSASFGFVKKKREFYLCFTYVLGWYKILLNLAVL